MTDSMKRALSETARRREKQEKFNAAHGITPKTITRGVTDILQNLCDKDYVDVDLNDAEKEILTAGKALKDRIAKLEKLMRKAAEELEFEQAAKLRDEIRRLEKAELRF